MKPPTFDYCRVGSLDEAVMALAEAGDDARILAGGQSLVPMLNMRLASPRLLVDINPVDAARYIRREDGWVAIGAATTQAALEAWPEMPAALPLVAEALPHIGHVQTRARGTVCGSIAHADPSAELPLCLALLGGQVSLRSSRGNRVVDAANFFQGLYTTDREPTEIVAEVRFPVAGGDIGHAFREVSERHGDFPLIALAGMVSNDTLSLAVGAAADRPMVRRWPASIWPDIDDALNDFAWELEATSDVHASARYRRGLVRRLGKQVLGDARANQQR